MAKKPAPLTSQLLVRKGEATPSSINPNDRATPAADDTAHVTDPETASASMEHQAEQQTAQLAEQAVNPGEPEAVLMASATPDAPAALDPRPQTPEPEFILATDDVAEERGSKRRLVGVLALVAVAVIGATAFGILGGDPNEPSVAPAGNIAATDTNTEIASAAPALAPSSPQSVGAPAAPDEIELRPGLNAGAPEGTETLAVEPVATTPAAPETPAASDVAEVTSAELPQPAPARAPIRIEPIVEPEAIAEPVVAAPVAPATVAPAAGLAQKGQYLIQLLASRSEADARRAWARVQSRYGDIIAGAALDLETADLGERGTYYRVRFGAFDERSAANAVCKALKDKGQDCLVKRAE